MKIIDDRGRLFGKWNVIDFLVVLFLLCLGPGIYFGYELATRKPQPPTITFDKAEYEQQEAKHERQKAEYRERQKALAVKIAECEAEIFEYKIRIDNLLKEHKRLKKYFE